MRGRGTLAWAFPERRGRGSFSFPVAGRSSISGFLQPSCNSRPHTSRGAPKNTGFAGRSSTRAFLQASCNSRSRGDTRRTSHGAPRHAQASEWYPRPIPRPARQFDPFLLDSWLLIPLILRHTTRKQKRKYNNPDARAFDCRSAPAFVAVLPFRRVGCVDGKSVPPHHHFSAHQPSFFYPSHHFSVRFTHSTQ